MQCMEGHSIGLPGSSRCQNVPDVLRDAPICWPVVDEGHAQAYASCLCLRNYPVQGSKHSLIKDACLWLQSIPLWAITCKHGNFSMWALASF